MRSTPVVSSSWAHLGIAIGVVGFLLALTISAVLVPELRVLHLFQALIYIAVLLLTRRDSPWGFGAGVLISLAWNAISLFVSHLFQAGAQQLWQFLRTGHIAQPVPFMVMVGGIAHFVLIVACTAAFLHLRPDLKAWGRFLGGGLLALAYFALIVSTTAPH